VTLPEGLNMIHMTAKGDTQGDILGSCTQAGYEDTIVVEKYSHSVTSPRDAASGLPTGKRQHKPITITKRIDKATPLFFNVLVNNENMQNVTFRFYRMSRSGARQHYYTVSLLNASIGDITQGDRDTETITFFYQKITWIWEDGGIEAQDDRETPNV